MYLRYLPRRQFSYGMSARIFERRLADGANSRCSTTDVGNASHAATSSLPSSLRIAAWTGVVVLIAALHGCVIIPQRERHERFLRGRIEELQAETAELQARLRETERGNFASGRRPASSA
eukprot:TRINITY_DN30625_c0_g1_i1.p2 TRINITY_DN30625_c0_g1~~TRINITY_DN30625_c0_g1_i1.p2  ORF type:complete len:120 (-),score=6.31 TRINITY_DN30625_c0_g1_i1:76-435(-)